MNVYEKWMADTEHLKFRNKRLQAFDDALKKYAESDDKEQTELQQQLRTAYKQWAGRLMDEKVNEVVEALRNLEIPEWEK